MPLAIGPQAVVCAPSRAACAVGPRAVAQFERPRNATHTRHRTLARAVVMTKKSAATASTAAMTYRVERFMAPKVGRRARVSTREPGGTSPPGSPHVLPADGYRDRKSTRLNSSHVAISYAVFCLK